MHIPEYIVIAPPSGDIPLVIPMGLVDLVKRLERPARGLYSSELKDDDIRAAKVAVLPVHWYYSLAPAIELSRRLKRINPDIRIVSGGYTASAYPKLLLANSAIDFVIKGDAEKSYIELMKRLLDGGDVAEVPNLVWRNGQTDLGYQVDEQTLAESHNRDLSWFPSLEKAAYASQKLEDPCFLFPWVVVSRGCVFDCLDCYASPSAQKLLVGRGMVRRPPETVLEDITYWSERADIRWCYFNSDFVSTLGMDWTEKALAGKFKLTAYHEWYRLPRSAGMDIIFDRFSSVVFGLFFRPDSECAQPDPQQRSHDTSRLLDVVRYCRDKARILLYVTPRLARNHHEYHPAATRLGQSAPLEFKLFDDAVIPPLVGRDESKRREDFAGMVQESGTRQRHLGLQHMVLAYAIHQRPFLYGLLWKASSAQVRLKMRLGHMLGRFRSKSSHSSNQSH